MRYRLVKDLRQFDNDTGDVTLYEEGDEVELLGKPECKVVQVRHLKTGIVFQMYRNDLEPIK